VSPHDRLLLYAKGGEHHRFWYDMQRRQIAAWCSAHGSYSRERFTAIFAITSPRVSVWQNWRLAIQYAKRMDMTSMMGTSRAALNHFEKTREIRGPKTKKFYDAIMGDPEALVLDVWMARALDIPHAVVNHPRNAEIAFRQVSEIAWEMRWTVAQAQAAIWRGIRHTWRSPAVCEEQNTRKNVFGEFGFETQPFLDRH
jgi:hypothetical protein